MTPDLRHNPLNGAPVLIVPGRASRPGATGRTTRVGEARSCPFCEVHERETPPEVDVDAAEGREHDTPGWKVRVVPNKYPAIPGHEVVIHGPDHLTTLADAHVGQREFQDAEQALLEAWDIAINFGPGSKDALTCARSHVDLYTAWDAAEPNHGYGAKLESWRRTTASFEAAKDE